MSPGTEPLIGRSSTQSEIAYGTFSRRQSRNFPDPRWIFDELPKATVVSVSRPDAGDIIPMLLSYTIEFQYKQFKWCLLKKASQILRLHFSVKKRAIIEDFHGKQEQIKEWLQRLGSVGHDGVVQDVEESDEGAVPLHQEKSIRNSSQKFGVVCSHVPSRVSLSIIRPTLGGQQVLADNAKTAMQNYLNHFLGDLGTVNSREVCIFLEVSKLSFSREYGPKLKEGYVMVKDLSSLYNADANIRCNPCHWFGCCNNNNREKVWAVLKPGFLALLKDPFDTKLLDIIVFDVLPISNKGDASHGYLANQIKERNPLLHAFNVSSGCRCIKFRTTSSSKVKEWVSAINDVGVTPLEGWCHPHRYGSFAPPRGLTEDGSQAQWFVDGQAAFEAIASAIEKAKSEIFITGWWVCPELYLRRPFESQTSSRLESLLEARAKEGVQIYVLLYKEVSIALKINSLYSKKRLENIHENLRVLRHPDHFSSGVYLWSHHEKLVIVDHHICFIGGMDLCFGRYDTAEHRVGDCPPNIWPGKDYYNPRESEPNSWEDTMKDEVDRTKYPRMPWHDVHCALWGPPCRDVARHFVQRWNHAKRSKAPNEQTIPLLIPHHHMVLPRYMGRSREVDIESIKAQENEKDICRPSFLSSPTPLQDIPLLLPKEADAQVVDIVDQDPPVKHRKYAHPSEFDGMSFSFQKPGDEDLDADELHFLDPPSKMHTSEETSAENDNVASAGDYGETGPQTACACQVVRSVCQWSTGASQLEESIHNACCSLIEKAEHFIYIENQFFISGLCGDDNIQNRVLDALYKRILKAHDEHTCFRIIIVIPLLPGFQGGLDDGGAATVRATMHWQYQTISRGKTSILNNLNSRLGPKMHDYISFYGLRTYGRLFEGGPLATNQVYVHSKLMIIDDRAAIIGSSNINDRSLLGSRDSEVGVFIEDKDFVPSFMNGEPWKAGRFAYSLRCSLWSEHLGLGAGEMSKISDPVAETTYRDLWMETAEENTKIYQDIFACLPNEDIRSRADLRQIMNYWKEKVGHTTIDLGIAPEKLERYENGESKLLEDPMEGLKSIKGHLVSFPLNFMCEEDLRPMFSEGEFYASVQVFH